MSRPRILVDVDGVLADFVGALCDCLAEAGHFYAPNDFKSWDLAPTLSPEAQRLAKAEMTTPGFVYNIDWYPGAKDFLVALQGIGDVYVVTSPHDESETWERERKVWLSSILPRKKVLPISGEEKRVVRGDILIEDHPSNAKLWLEENTSGTAILIDQPWNGPQAKEFCTHERMHRVSSYTRALQFIRYELAGAA